MSAALIPDLQGTGLDAGPAPVWIKSNAKTFHLVHPEYLRSPHTAAEMSAVVTQNGEPIVMGGETQTVGGVPPWRRFAIQHAVNGKAEILSQDDFVRAERRIFEDSFRLRGEKLESDPDKRYIPNVRAFVSVKLDVMQPGRICPLGTHLEKQAVKQGPQAYDASNDRFIDRQVNEAEERMKAEIAAKDERLEALEAVVAKLAGQTPTPKPAPAALVTAKCGKEVNAKYLKNHERFCKKGCADGDVQNV